MVLHQDTYDTRTSLQDGVNRLKKAMRWQDRRIHMKIPAILANSQLKIIKSITPEPLSQLSQSEHCLLARELIFSSKVETILILSSKDKTILILSSKDESILMLSSKRWNYGWNYLDTFIQRWIIQRWNSQWFFRTTSEFEKSQFLFPSMPPSLLRCLVYGT